MSKAKHIPAASWTTMFSAVDEATAGDEANFAKLTNDKSDARRAIARNAIAMAMGHRDDFVWSVEYVRAEDLLVRLLESVAGGGEKPIASKTIVPGSTPEHIVGDPAMGVDLNAAISSTLRLEDAP